MYQFKYHQAASIDEAVSAMAAAEDGKFVAGGQTMLPTMKHRLASPSDVIDLGRIAELRGIQVSKDAVTIGAMSTHGEVAASAEVAGAIPALASLAGHIGDPAVRNRGTIGGSLANNDPSACYPSAALASGATIVTNAREIAADDYFQGMFTTALEEGEIITAVKFPIPEAANYQKFLQPASRFALVGVFVAKYADGVRVAVTGASEDGVFRWSEAEAALSKEFQGDALMDLKVDPANMIGDLHGTKEYRAHLVGVLTKRAVAAAG